MISPFWTGLAVGVMLTIPLAIIATRRTARRVRQLEQRARANERLAELGTLTGGLAHEIKNPLTPIQLSAERLQHKLEAELQGPSVEILRRGTRTIVNQVASMKQMVESLAS